MAERRMFAKSIVQTDEFFSLPTSAQALYYALCMTADDDGFTKMANSILKLCGCKKEDLTILIESGYIISFSSGVIVIVHWKIHNYLQKNMYKPTLHELEKKMLFLDEKTRLYTILDKETTKQDEVAKQYSIDKISIGKLGKLDKDNYLIPAPCGRIASENKKHKYGEYKNVLLSDEELNKLKEKFSDWEKRINAFSEGIEMKGYKYKSHYLAILKWAKNEEKEVKNNEKSTIQFTDER